MSKPRANNHQVERAARQAASDITTIETDITNIETKTDYISVTGAVDLDDMQSASALPAGINGFEGRIAKLGGNDSTISTKTTTYSAVANDCIFLVDSTSGDVTIDLPTAVGISGKRYIFKLIEASNTCIIDGNGTETIDTALTKVLSVLQESVTIVSDNANWHIIG